MNFSFQQYLDHEARIARQRKTVAPVFSPAERETGDGGLHAQIMAHCDRQWPRWKYIHSRTDQRSTVEVGAPDFVIFMPEGRIIVVEGKAKGGKVSPEQLAWKLQLELLKTPLHFVWSFEEFLKIVGPGKGVIENGMRKEEKGEA